MDLMGGREEGRAGLLGHASGSKGWRVVADGRTALQQGPETEDQRW